MARIRVSIVTYNNAETIGECLRSLHPEASGPDVAVTVVDNDSRDGTAAYVRDEFPWVEVVEAGSNVGFGAGHNLVLRSCEEHYALIINPDAWLMEGALARLLGALEEHDDVALAGPRIEYGDGSPQLNWGAFPGLFRDVRQRRRTIDLRERRPRAVDELNRHMRARLFPDWISGACFLGRMEHMRRVGLFDEHFFLYLEDVDLCKRLSTAGLRVMIEPRAVCRHVEGHSHEEHESMVRHFRRSRLIYENKHGSRFGFSFYKFLRGRDLDQEYDPGLRWRHNTDSTQ